MKPATARSVREQQRERQRRERASAATVRAQFPTVATIRLDLEFNDETAVLPAPQTFVLHPPAPAYFVIPCPYSDCDGQFDLTAEVMRLRQGGDSRGDGQQQCCGHRFGSDRDGRRACRLRLQYSISID